MKFDLKKGFTLIELLVVISIISLLSAIILANLLSASRKAQDAQVVSEIHQYQSAMELYYLDHGHYPAPSSNSLVCLGQAPCMYFDSQYSPDSTLNSELSPYIPDAPPVLTGLLSVSNGMFPFKFQNATYLYSVTSCPQNPSGTCVDAFIYWPQVEPCTIGTPIFYLNNSLCYLDFKEDNR